MQSILFPRHFHAAEHWFFMHEHFINFIRNSGTHASSHMTKVNIPSFKDYPSPTGSWMTGSGSSSLDHTSSWKLAFLIAGMREPLVGGNLSPRDCLTMNTDWIKSASNDKWILPTHALYHQALSH